MAFIEYHNGLVVDPVAGVETSPGSNRRGDATVDATYQTEKYK